jgi:hypothetical protein
MKHGQQISGNALGLVICEADDCNVFVDTIQSSNSFKQQSINDKNNIDELLIRNDGFGLVGCETDDYSNGFVDTIDESSKSSFIMPPACIVPSSNDHTKKRREQFKFNENDLRLVDCETDDSNVFTYPFQDSKNDPLNRDIIDTMTLKSQIKQLQTDNQQLKTNNLELNQKLTITDKLVKKQLKQIKSDSEYIFELEDQLRISKTVFRDKSVEACINIDSLKDNSILRVNVEKLKHKLKSQMGNEYYNWIQCLRQSQIKTNTYNMTDEISKLINIHNEDDIEKIMIDQSVQTCTDFQITSLELKITDLNENLSCSNKNLLNEKKINSNLSKCLDDMQIETKHLMNTLTSLKNDTEVSQASTRLTMTNLTETKLKVEKLQIINKSLQLKLNDLEYKLIQHQHAHSVIDQMSLKTNIPLNFKLNDPISVIEYQWKYDRERLNIQIETLKSENYILSKKHEQINDELELKISKMYDETEWNLL